MHLGESAAHTPAHLAEPLLRGEARGTAAALHGSMRNGFPLVLLAEDDVDLRELIASRLTREGMKVVQVEDGFELRDYLALCRPGGRVPEPDVVVSDVNMPGESGPHALETSALHSPVVLITSAADEQMRASAAAAGVVEVFEKPFALKELVSTIRRITERRFH